MKRDGFHLRKLIVTGKGREPAVLDFGPGLNVIAGVSNSGKTYVLQCIDWLMGASQAPKSIKESRGYEKAYLELTTKDDRVLTLVRALKAGGAEYWEGHWDNAPIHRHPLAGKHRPGSEETISHLLLSLFGAAGAKVRRNARNELQELSFRTIAHLFIVNELEILGERSPLFLDEVRANPSAVAAFSYVLTGLDDSALLPEIDPKVEKAVRAGRRDLLQDLVSELEASLADEDGIQEGADDLEQRLAEISSSVTRNSEAVAEAWKTREAEWSTLKSAESRLIALRELGKRYRLLSDHYESDLRRLEFMEEGRQLVEQLETVRCPFCGGDLDEHVEKALCTGEGADALLLSEACRTEARKIRSQQRDLTAAERDLRAEIEELVRVIEDQAKELDSIEGRIRSELEPMVAASRQELESLLERRRISEARTISAERLDALKRLLLEEEARRKTTSPKEPVPDDHQDGMEALAVRRMCDTIEGLLQAWRVKCKTVEFSEKSYDLVVDGVPRRSNGKGVRGLWHSAFNVGLMLAAMDGDGRHPGFVVLDSPLTTLREGAKSEDGEEVPGEVQQAFFEHLATLGSDVQVVVLENKEPPSKLAKRIRFERFVGGSGGGRAGFFPIVSGPAELEDQGAN
jgi:cell division septum initiation protein DivIVA